MWEKWKADFVLNFIDNDRWLMLVRGLIATLKITVVALLIGVAIGVLVAAIRTK